MEDATKLDDLAAAAAEWLRLNDPDLANSSRTFPHIKENGKFRGPVDEEWNGSEDFDKLLETAMQPRTHTAARKRATLVSVDQAGSTDRICANCMEVFESTRPWHLYHSEQCREAARPKRKRKRIRKPRDRALYMREYRARKQKQA